MRRMRKVLPIILVLVVLCGAFYAWRTRQARAKIGPEGPVLTVTFLEAKLGGGVVVHTPDGALAIIDPGPESTGKELASYLEDQNARDATVVLTNPSAQRTGALQSLLESLVVKRIIRGEMDTGAGALGSALDDARGRSIPELVLSASDGVGLSKKARIEVLSPPKGLIKDTDRGSESNSLVATITFGRIRFLLASDADIATEGHLIKSGADLTSDVLAVGRHGDDRATSLEFVSFVRPRYLVVSSGGALGRPNRAVLSRIGTRNTGAEVYRTDREGRVAVITDGRTIAVESERGGRE